ncbi:MAG TPA: hypothetical protein VIL72_00040 [Beijerinckiaceae bacterium]
MLRMLAAGVWGGLVAVGASFGAGLWLDRAPAAAGHATPAQKVELKKTPPLNVPIVRDGVLQGYFVLQVGYMVESEAFKAQPDAPEAFVLDETFRATYADDTIDFRKLQKYDIDALMQRVLTRVRARMKSEIVKDVLVQEFSFVPTSSLRH